MCCATVCGWLVLEIWFLYRLLLCELLWFDVGFASWGLVIYGDGVGVVCLLVT